MINHHVPDAQNRPRTGPEPARLTDEQHASVASACQAA
jgi:hypothetical protein